MRGHASSTNEAIPHPRIPAHDDIEPRYDFFSKHWTIVHVQVSERPAYTDPAWDEPITECVVWGTTFWEKVL